MKKFSKSQGQIVRMIFSLFITLVIAVIPIGAQAARITPSGAINLNVSQSGLHRLTYEMLRDAGLDWAGVAPAKITLTNRGNAVPVYVEAKGRFGPGAYIEFYGQALDTIYTDTNVYTLQAGQTTGALIPVVKAAPSSRVMPVESYTETLAVNNQRGYANYAPGTDAWYDTSMLAYKASQDWDFTFDVDGLADASASSALELVVWGVTGWPQAPDHHLLVSVNGATVADQTFDGLTEQTLNIPLPGGLLREGANTLRLTLPGDTDVNWDLVNLDKFSVTYQRVFQAADGRLTFTAAGQAFEVTNLPSGDVVVYREENSELKRLGQVQVQAAPDGSFTAAFAGTEQASTYMVSAASALYAPGLESPRPWVDLNRPAQYLVIAHPDFIAGLGALVQARQAQGLTVNVVDVNDLYAQYRYGIFDPQAIQEYIAYAAQNLGTEYVLLVGGDTYDYRNYLGANSVSYIPSLYVSTGPTVKYVPSDPVYADVNNDRIPDLAIGRFPVRTAGELDLLVNKTLAYAAKDYGRTASFVSDRKDGGANFKNIMNAMAAKIPANWTVETIHVDDLGAAEARTRLLESMNRGTALVTYMGHADSKVWTYSGLFDTADAAALTNYGRPFVAVQWGCWTIYDLDPSNASLAHSLLFSGDQGAVAVLGATTLTGVGTQAYLGQLLTPRLATPGMSIGQAVRDAKLEFAQFHPGLSDVLLGWSLLGDPALVIEP